ncbi:peptidoglycan DD-metalloendopeptidase family protein [Streptomyces tendae]|uniref:peptidoglycan DD-metalloendopeptidase family protein n=1 Tax=Streptomyces tendae TaxID=1932 RepID=UPI0036C473C6
MEATLTLDRSEFVQGLRDAKAEAAEFERQTFKAKLDVDARDALRTVATVRAELASLRNVSLNVGVTGSNAQIRAISQSASALNGRTVTMSVSVAGVAEATASLTALRAHADALDGRTIRIRADFDGGAALAQIATLRAALAGLDGTTARTSGSFSGAGRAGGFLAGQMGTITAAAMLAAPALFPLGAAALNVAGTFTALGVAVGGGLGIFTAATVGAVKGVTELDKAVATAKKNLDAQRETLARLTPGTDAYALQLKKVEDAQRALTAAQAAYTPEQRAFSDAVGGMKTAWQDFVTATQGTTLPIVTTFVTAVSEALPKAVPAVKAMAPEVKAIANDVRRWVGDGGFDRFIGSIIQYGVPAFRDLRIAAKDVLAALGTGFRAFLPQSEGMALSLRQGAAALRSWADGGGFQRFIGYVQQNAPQVREFFSALFGAIRNVGAALAPLGPLGLGFVTVVLQLVAALPPEWIRAVYLGFVAWKIIGVITALWRGMQAAILAVRSAMFALSIAFGVTPFGWVMIAIGLLVVGLIALAAKMGWLQTAWKAAWAGIQFAAQWAWNNVLKPAWEGIKTGLHAIGTAAMWLWTNAIKPAWDFISVGSRLLVVILGTILFTPLYLAFKLLRVMVLGIWNSVFKPVFGWIGQGAKALWDLALKPAFDLMVAGLKTLGNWGKWLWNNAIKPAWNGIADGTKWLWNTVVKPLVVAFWEGLKTLGGWGKWLWNNALKPTWNGIADGTKWLWNKGVKPILGYFVDGLKTLAGWGKWLWDKGLKPQWDRISTGTGHLKDAMVEIFDKMKGGIEKIWNGIKKIAAVPINFVIDTVYNGGVVKVWNKIADAVGLKDKKLGTVGRIKYAQGGAAGPVYGGMAGLDSVPATLMPNEHVWTAEEVKNAGGHKAVAQMRAMFSGSGRARVAPGGGAMKFADGGGIFGTGVGPDFGPNVVGGIKDTWSAGLSLLNDVKRGAIGAVANPLLDKIKAGIASGIGSVIPGKPAWEDLAKGVASKPIDWVKAWIADDDAKNAPTGGGQWIKPVNAPYGTPFGKKGSMWSSGYHTGLDFPAPTGRGVVAVDTGRVASVSGSGPYGNHVTVDHGGGLASMYAHLSRVNAKPGAILQGGSIGAVGATGNVTGPHLHLEARERGKAVDPMRYLQGGGGGGSGRWSSTVTAVLKELGMYTPANLTNVLKAIQKESGGNPNAVNNWDSNARAGHPSKGLLQTIDSTFNAYAGKYRSKGVFDPYANIYAAVRYANATYGPTWSYRMARPGGYALGGVTTPGLHLMGEKGPELVATSGNDRVFTASETQQMLRNTGGGGGTIVVQLPEYFIVRIGDREFRAMLDEETREILTDVISDANWSR